MTMKELDKLAEATDRRREELKELRRLVEQLQRLNDDMLIYLGHKKILGDKMQMN